MVRDKPQTSCATPHQQSPQNQWAEVMLVLAIGSIFSRRGGRLLEPAAAGGLQLTAGGDRQHRAEISTGMRAA